jgi:hypothetical protein
VRVGEGGGGVGRAGMAPPLGTQDDAVVVRVSLDVPRVSMDGGGSGRASSIGSGSSSARTTPIGNAQFFDVSPHVPQDMSGSLKRKNGPCAPHACVCMGLV